MRRVFSTALMTLAATAIGISTAAAQSPHFIGDVTCSKSLSGLSCSGKAAGLGNVATDIFLTASSVEAEYVCVNRGGNIAPGQGTEFQNVQGPTQHVTPRNGQITFRNVTLPAPETPSEDDVCPNGNWRVQLLHLTFNDVELHVQQNGEDILVRDLGDIDP
ncbi:hypothetical protein [Streptomyces sp. NBC_00038]|uniref:hypothetical protein n=1 Tax=Streptomyces sp. NBC_00038 TaxID=2903615 RepID=UPI00225B6B21|nr:hypothetical protein [Streptomyces sp. NBC_00038]MCX5560125.1 hypothetical protein [Streptomyces sp. NBC_00038]